MRHVDFVKQERVRRKGFDSNYDAGYAKFELGLVFRQARLDAGLDQMALALRADVGKHLVSRIENKGGTWDEEPVRRIFSVLETQMQAHGVAMPVVVAKDHLSTIPVLDIGLERGRSRLSMESNSQRIEAIKKVTT